MNRIAAVPTQRAFETERDDGFPSGESSRVDFAGMIQTLIERRKLVLICIGVGAALAIFSALILMPRYTAKALLIYNDSETADSARRADDSAIDTHIAMLTSRAHLDRALAEMNNDELLSGRFKSALDVERHLKVMQELRSHLISVNFTARSPEVAARVANEIAEAYVDESLSPDASAEASARQMRRIDELEGKYRQALTERKELDGHPDADAAALSKADARVADLQQELDAERLNQTLAQRQAANRRQVLALSPPIKVYALARPPEQPSSARPILIIVPAIIASALFGVALALLLGRLDRHIRNAGDLRRTFPFPVAGSAPPKLYQPGQMKSSQRNAANYDAAIEEMAVNIFMAPGARTKQTVVVAPAGGSQQNDLAFDLALAASRMKSVLLAVADHDSMAAQYAEAADAARRGGAQIHCCLLAADRADLLAQAASGALARTLQDMRRCYDWIVLAAPSTSASPAARVMVRLADSVVLNVAAGATEYRDVATSLREVSASGEASRAGRPRRKVFFALTDAEAPSVLGPINWEAQFTRLTALRTESFRVLQPLRKAVARRLPDGQEWIVSLTRPAPDQALEARPEDKDEPNAADRRMMIGGAAE
jgi:capsular polysaccharide biosynthesis protein